MRRKTKPKKKMMKKMKKMKKTPGLLTLHPRRTQLGHGVDALGLAFVPEVSEAGLPTSFLRFRWPRQQLVWQATDEMLPVLVVMLLLLLLVLQVPVSLAAQEVGSQVQCCPGQ